MKAKKNPQKDLNRFRTLFFQSGLILVLLMVWLSFERVQSPVNNGPYVAVNMDDNLTLEIPEIQIEKPELPEEKPKMPDKLELVPNDTKADIPEFLSTESYQGTTVVDISDIKVAHIETPVEVEFINVEQIPLFPACVNVPKEAQRDCFQSEMGQHVRKNFSYPSEAIDLNIQGRVYVMFTIDENGEVSNIRLRGPDRRLEAETKRIIEKLPQMIPGKMGEKKVRVPYSLPINFVLKQ